MSGLVAITYIAVAFLAWWPCSHLVLDAFAFDEPDPTDVAFSAFFGAVMAVLWPVVLLGVAGFRLSRAIWSRVLGGEREART